MGFKENLIQDWKYKTLEYQGKRFYIMDQFKFEDKEYLCGCDIDTINKENLEVTFLYKIKDDIFEHVEDKELFEELLIHVSGSLIAEKLLDIYEEYKDDLK